MIEAAGVLVLGHRACRQVGHGSIDIRLLVVHTCDSRTSRETEYGPTLGLLWTAAESQNSSWVFNHPSSGLQLKLGSRSAEVDRDDV